MDVFTLGDHRAFVEADGWESFTGSFKLLKPSSGRVNKGERPERRSDGYSVGLRGEEDALPPQQDPALLRQLEREFGESPAHVERMTDAELRAYLALLWDRRART